MADLPWTPDFDHWPIRAEATALDVAPAVLSVTWSDGRTSRHDVLLLRENCPDPGTIHPKAREMVISPNDIPADIAITGAGIEPGGAVRVAWSDGTEGRFHPGWLHGTAWFGEEPGETRVLWTGEELAEPPSFDGPRALAEPAVFADWLEAVRDYGVARLRGLPQGDGLLEEVVTRIGPVRESNFGRDYVLAIKDDPDSLAYTTAKLMQHIDMPTRETPHGLQFLYCRENTATGGDGIYVDAYRVAADMAREDPEHYRSLVTDNWEYNNRARDTDYRAAGPVVETDALGRIAGIRYNTFLRAPMKAPVEVQARAYRAYRAFCARAQDPRYEMVFRYEPGDLLAFDNRRALHGRSGYDGAGGARFIEGIYSDRDDLHSCIRTLRRRLREAAE